jgi:HD-GYP domain-containing protein (c-di-GMP phosphodiesterase class II)
VVAAASVHDIGKIGVPNEYLAKPGKLEAVEWAVIQTHAKKGYDILKPLETEFPVAEIVYQHHERLDGSGYPRGIKGAAFLREAQIVALADISDSVINARPYRKALGKDYALSIIQNDRGVKFAEDICEACATVIGETF